MTPPSAARPLDPPPIMARRRFRAPPRVVYDLFVDRLWRGGAGMRPRPVIEERGERDGLGCTRRIGPTRWAVRERITATAAPFALEYRVLPGSPLFPAQHHLGVVAFHGDPDGGTRLEWRVEFGPRRVAMVAMVRLVQGWYLAALVHAVRQKRTS